MQSRVAPALEAHQVLAEAVQYPAGRVGVEEPDRGAEDVDCHLRVHVCSGREGALEEHGRAADGHHDEDGREGPVDLQPHGAALLLGGRGAPLPEPKLRVEVEAGPGDHEGHHEGRRQNACVARVGEVDLPRDAARGLLFRGNQPSRGLGPLLLLLFVPFAFTGRSSGPARCPAAPQEHGELLPEHRGRLPGVSVSAARRRRRQKV